MEILTDRPAQTIPPDRKRTDVTGGRLVNRRLGRAIQMLWTGIAGAASGQIRTGFCDEDERQQPPLNRFENCEMTPEGNSPDTFDNYGDVTRRRYPLSCLSRWLFLNTLYLLTIINLVPVAGLEPARLFMVPGF